MFYTIFDGKYYILDEELKVLRIYEVIKDDIASKPPQLTHIKENSLNITSETKVCDFVGSEIQQQIAYNLYLALVNNVKDKYGDEVEYYSRKDFSDILKYIEFESYDTFNKIILTTKYGIKFDIEDLVNNATIKMNICLTLMNNFASDENNNREFLGTIKIYYDLVGEQKTIYIPHVEELPTE